MFEPPCPDLEGPAAGIFPNIRALWRRRDERGNTRARYDEISKSDRSSHRLRQFQQKGAAALRPELHGNKGMKRFPDFV